MICLIKPPTVSSSDATDLLAVEVLSAVPHSARWHEAVGALVFGGSWPLWKVERLLDWQENELRRREADGSETD